MQAGDTTGDTKTGTCSVSRNAKGNRSYTRAADHGMRFFNIPDLTSSVKRRLSARARRRFARGADPPAAGPTPGLQFQSTVGAPAGRALPISRRLRATPVLYWITLVRLMTFRSMRTRNWE